MSAKQNIAFRMIPWALIAVLLIPAGCGLLTMGEYRNSEKGYSISYPKKWEMQEDSAGADVIFLEPEEKSEGLYRRNVAVISSELPSGAKKSDHYILQFNAISAITPKLSNFRLHTNKFITIDGVQGKQMTFSYDIEGVHLKVISRTVIKENRGYVIMGSSERLENFYDQYKKIAESFRFL